MNKKPRLIMECEDLRVCTMLANGAPYKQIEAELGICEKTVRNKLRRLKTRHQACTVVQLIARLVSQQLIKLNEVA